MEWLDRQQGKLEPMLSTMRDVEQKRMRGFRVELVLFGFPLNIYFCGRFRFGTSIPGKTV